MTPSRQDLRDLYDDYAAHLDDGDLDAWVDMFTDNAQYLVVARENWDRGLPLATIRCDGRGMLVDRAHTIRSTQFYAPRVVRHFVSGVRLLGADSGVACTANFLVTEALELEPARIHLTGQYRDTVVATPAGLRFARKVAIYDGALVQTSLVHPV